jgi:hypothetical protein
MFRARSMPIIRRSVDVDIGVFEEVGDFPDVRTSEAQTPYVNA